MITEIKKPEDLFASVEEQLKNGRKWIVLEVAPNKELTNLQFYKEKHMVPNIIPKDSVFYLEGLNIGLRENWTPPEPLDLAVLRNSEQKVWRQHLTQEFNNELNSFGLYSDKQELTNFENGASLLLFHQIIRSREENMEVSATLAKNKDDEFKVTWINGMRFCFGKIEVPVGIVNGVDLQQLEKNFKNINWDSESAFAVYDYLATSRMPSLPEQKQVAIVAIELDKLFKTENGRKAAELLMAKYWSNTQPFSLFSWTTGVVDQYKQEFAHEVSPNYHLTIKDFFKLFDKGELLKKGTINGMPGEFKLKLAAPGGQPDSSWSVKVDSFQPEISQSEKLDQPDDPSQKSNRRPSR